MKYLTLDFETYYDKAYSLSKKDITTQDYVMDTRFNALMVGLKWGDEPTVVVDEQDIAAALAAIDWSDTALIAHNAVFDAAILFWRYGHRPAMVIDTMSMAQSLGVPLLTGSASLDKCVRLLVEAGYDVPFKGEEVLNALGKHRKDFLPHEWQRYRDYCAKDVDITWYLFKVLRQLVPDDEMAYQDIILRCYTEPMLTVDVPAVQYELARTREYKRTQLAAVCEQLGCTQEQLAGVLRSNDKFAGLLRAIGGITETELLQGAKGSFIIPTKVSATTGKTTWAFGKADLGFKALCESDDPFVQALCMARLAAKSTIDETRCEKFLKYASYGFLPMGYKISGAHTGRLSGGSAGSANMQNLPSGRGKGQSDLLRRSIIAAGADNVIVNFDASQIECLSGEGVVLTQLGLIPIANISTDDLLWDGLEWVTHDGVVMKGVKDVITYAGITATSNHIVYTQCGRAIPLGQAACERAKILVGEVGGQAVRVLDGVGQTDTIDDTVHSRMVQMPVRSGTTGECQRRGARYDEWGNRITGTIQVYDIINAGPRHRFTYNGLIVSNCRVLAYMADQTDVLGVFASNGDVYSYAAAPLYGISYSEIVTGRKSSDPETAAKYSAMRQYGKVATLALGYGQGATGFQKYALLTAGINMDAAEAKRVVTVWRKSNAHIVQFWTKCDYALQVMVNGGRFEFGGADGKLFLADGSRVLLGRRVPGIRLPTGIWLNYPNLRMESGEKRPQFVFDKMGYSGKPLTEKTYGGKIAENITQALAFAVMKAQALHIAEYYPIKMNTHDEWCIVVPREQAEVAAEYMERCMKFTPPFVAGLPLNTEGGWAQSYGAVDDNWSTRPDNPDRKHIFDPTTGAVA